MSNFTNSDDVGGAESAMSSLIVPVMPAAPGAPLWAKATDYWVAVNFAAGSITFSARPLDLATLVQVMEVINKHYSQWLAQQSAVKDVNG